MKACLSSHPDVLQDTGGAGRIVNAAGAELGQVGGGLLGVPAAFLDPVDHLLGEVVGDHAVTAHGGELQNAAVRQEVEVAVKAEGVLHAVPRDPGPLTAGPGPGG